MEQRRNPTGILARVTDHAVRRYAERALGVTVAGDDDGAAMTALRTRSVNVGRIRRHLAILGGLGVANAAGAVVAEGLKLVLVDGAVVTVLATKVRVDMAPAGPSSPVPRRQRTCLDAEYAP
ncbi:MULTISPECIES: hypothetical protein [Methylobacteriaceae]|uniref:hypothetical protein n=1 Tax=Methylobacteriaceae TaxID=119045 RepID=UPI000CDB2358|nr:MULTISPECIES: hypothetical protein [Methylobacteriaceae]MCP1549430.1 hypothetical protein [Methylorubrum zatmanii]MCP1553957.1 hypothetical protein [Methylorubrum extorquens]MCP1579732.1 hypothetical protein [Methylorubrum extorquens]POR41010.1 hypothetical protein CRT23_21200 [Methylobacterium sp. V23]